MPKRRSWVKRFAVEPSTVFEDWEAFCQSPHGVFVATHFKNTRPSLPPMLRRARSRLVKFVPAESSRGVLDASCWNGQRYYLRRVTREVRRFGEQAGCVLEFGPSDYRTFLATNGMEEKWAKRAGLSRSWKGAEQWAARWTSEGEDSLFFENSFGVDVLVTARGDDGDRYALFFERGGRTAVRSHSTVGVDEGLRRRYGQKLYDEKSRANPAPSLSKAVYRALKEEAGVSRQQTRGSAPILLSAGRVRSIRQPAALYYLPLDMSVDQLRHSVRLAQDRHLESREHHFVRFDLNSLVRFVLKQESSSPVETWVIAMCLYALETEVAVKRRVFLAHSHADKRFVLSLAADLRRSGIGVWIDEAEINIGESLISKIRQGIDDVDFVVAVISSNSVKSAWVKEELELAMNQQIESRRVKVLPVLRDTSRLPGFLKGKLYGDFTSSSRRQKSVERLTKAILELEVASRD